VNALSFDRGRHTAAFDGESYWGYGQYTSLERHARFWSFDFDYWASSPTFRTDNGFEFQNDFRRVTAFQELNVYAKGFLNQIGGGVFFSRTWNFDDVRKRDIAEPGLWADLPGQTFLNVWYTIDDERFRGIDFETTRRWGFYGRTAFSELVRLELVLVDGRRIARFEDPPVLGDGTDVEMYWTIRPTMRLVLQPTLRYADLRPLDGGASFFSGYIFRARASYQFNREVFLRVVAQYDEFNRTLSVEPLLTYKVNPYTLFYVGSTLGYEDYDTPDEFAPTSRQFFAKFQYLFRT
jgi:hypothetical protein